MDTARSGIGWLIAQMGALAVAWIASIYFARTLPDPQTSLGTFYAFETVVTFLVLLGNGGLNEAIVKRVSEGRDPEQFATAGLLLSISLVVTVSAGILLSSQLLINFFNFGGISVLVIIVTVISYQMRDTLGALLASKFQVGRSGAINFANSVGQVAVQVSLVSIGFGAIGLMIGYMAGAVFASLIAICLVSNRFNIASPTKHHIYSLVRFARYSFLNNFVQKFYDNIDIIIITILLGTSSTGVYGIGFRFSLLVMVIYSAITRSVAPEISRLDMEGNNERIRELLNDSIVLGLFFGIPALAGFGVLAQPIIVTFYTEEFASAAVIAFGAVATRIPEGLRSTASAVLSGMDRPDITFRGGAILMITNLVLDLILVPTIGIKGAVVASFAGMSLQLLYLTYYLFSILDLSYVDLPGREVLAEVLAALVMAGVVYAVRARLPGMSAALLVGLVLLGVITYFTVIIGISGGVRRRVFGIARTVIP
mgnify:CR=1 FL=1